MTRATVTLSLACNNECVFCGQSTLESDRSPRAAAVVLDALRVARSTADEVTFVGGEPSLHAELADFVRAARAMGFARVGLQTNARSVDLRALADAGLTDVHLSIHGAVAAAHDYHTGIEGSFDAALATLGEARALDLVVAVNTVLTRSNARGLAELAVLLAERFASAWCISVPRVRGRALELFDRVVPRLGIAMPFALHAIKTARSMKLEAFVRGAPSCVLGPFARHALADEARSHGAPCETCAARPTCPGVDAEYLARFAGDELSARDLLSAEVETPLTRLFVGPGELAPSRDAPLADHPARARVALPMLGKVKPALAEVSRTAEKKTGAALRELFKDLYSQEEPRD